MTKLQSLICRFFSIASPEPAERPIVPVLRDANTIKLATWRAKESLTEASRLLAMNKTYQLQIVVLNNEHPCHTVLGLGTSPNDRLVLQARIEGYNLCLSHLEAMSKPLKLVDRLEETFAPEEPQRRK